MKRVDVVIVKSRFNLPTFEQILETVVNVVARHLDSDPETLEFTIFKAYAGGGLPRTHIMFDVPEDVEIDVDELKTELAKEFAEAGLNVKWLNTVKLKEIKEADEQ